MKLTKILGVAAVAALALMAFASSASATTLEVKGVAKNEAVKITATLESSTTLDMTDTSGFFANRCSESHLEWTATTPFSATRVGGPVASLTFKKCTEDAKEATKVDLPGYLTVEAIAGTTNGTVFSDSAEITTPSPFGKLNCKTSATGTDIGKLTGKASGFATMDIEAVLNCSIITARWKGSYLVTTPEGPGVVS
jgi:hypothetical protein